jgi:NAD(P)-dependent dehydrogenase (short-subunit alcohol dehydrogenase family)
MQLEDAPTIDGELRTGHVAGFVGDEKEHCLGDVAGLAHALRAARHDRAPALDTSRSHRHSVSRIRSTQVSPQAIHRHGRRSSPATWRMPSPFWFGIGAKSTMRPLGCADQIQSSPSMSVTIDQFVEQHQLIKRPGRMTDLVNALFFLCGEESSFITGETLLVSGG